MEEPIAARPTQEPPTSAEAPGEPPRRWKNLEARRASRRRRILSALAVLALATLAGLVATIGWFRPVQRPALVLLGGPSGGLAAIPYADDDRRGLVASAAFRPAEGPTSIDRALASIATVEQPGTLVVHVAARAWIEAPEVGPGRPTVRFAKEGETPTPGRSPTGPSLDDLVAAVRANPAAHKLLILDVYPPPEDPRLGAVLDDVGAAVAETATEADKDDDSLSILASCAPGQAPLASEALGRSAFGYYVERGLRGDADASGDGRVGVRELAGFVRLRVGRWASKVRGARQSPALFEGPGHDDFPLAVVNRRTPRPPSLEKEVPAYPAWLLDGWRGRDLDRRVGVDRQAPRAFGQVEAALLLAERDWRGKVDEARVRADLTGQLERLRDRIAATRSIPRPRARSLAQEAAAGAVPDPEVLKAVRDVLARRASPTPESKPGEVEAANARLIVEFAATAKIKSDFDLAAATWLVAAEDQAPSPEVVGFLDRLARSRQPRPGYVESLALHRLAGLPGSGWSPEVARLAMALTRRGEAAQARPAAVFGSSRRLDDADRLRHEAEALLAMPGYARPGEVETRLDRALVATDAASNGASAVEEARALLDEAMRTLPVAVELLDLGELERSWFAAAASAGRLADRLASTPGVDEARPLDGLADRSEELRGLLAPFGPPAIAARVARLTRPASTLGPADLAEVDALLATPLPLAEQRAALWKSGITLARRLAEAALIADPRTAAALDLPEPSRPRADPAPVEGPKPRRARVSDDLLALSGAKADGWAGLVAAASDPARSVEARDRAARLAWPWAESPTLDEPANDPARLRRIAEFEALRRWLAARYAFEARDPDRSDFFAEAALDFAGPGEGTPSPLTIEAEPASAGLDVDHPVATVRLGLRASSASAPARVEVATADDDWLDVSAGSAAPARASRLDVTLQAGSAQVPLTIALRPESEATRSPIPPGVLVRVRWSGRTYHRRIPLRIEPESRRPRLIFAASPSGPSPTASEVRPRATQGKVGYSIYVENPGDRDRRFVVGLGDRRGAIAGASTTVTVRAGETTRVAFGPAAANPEAGFVEVHGPLTIRMVDADDPGFQVVRTIPVGLASPSDYVRVVSTRYVPPGSAAGEKPRLEFKLQAVGPIEGGPCPVELSLPVDRIPGLLGVGEGTFREKLEKLGDEKILFVEDFELDARSDEVGFVHLAVDGVDRAFVYRVRFARRGPATTPSRDVRPAVRLKAGRVALSTAPLKVEVEVDNPPEPGRLTLRLGQYTGAGPGDFRADSTSVDDASRGRVRLNPRGPDGSLVFEATARDSSVSFDAGKVRGRRLIRASLVDERDVEKASGELPLVLDDRPASGVAFDSPPKYGLKGGTVALKASGRAPDSGIQEVAFFAGRPVDGKRPPGAAVVAGKPVGRGGESWSAALPLSDARPGPLDVTVEFVAGAGPSQFATATIAVVEAIPVEPGSILGTVKLGELAQPGIEVLVFDDKDVQKGKTTTDDSGKFEVGNLAPGTYKVISGRATPPTRGSVDKAVKAGEKAVVEVSIFRLP